MFKLPIYSKKKLLLAFEYGVILAKTAKDMNIEMTPEFIVKCEEMITKEFTEKKFEKIALEMVPNILASFETK